MSATHWIIDTNMNNSGWLVWTSRDSFRAIVACLVNIPKRRQVRLRVVYPITSGFVIVWYGR